MAASTSEGVVEASESLGCHGHLRKEWQLATFLDIRHVLQGGDEVSDFAEVHRHISRERFEERREPDSFHFQRLLLSSGLLEELPVEREDRSSPCGGEGTVTGLDERGSQRLGDAIAEDALVTQTKDPGDTDDLGLSEIRRRCGGRKKN